MKKINHKKALGMRMALFLTVGFILAFALFMFFAFLLDAILALVLSLAIVLLWASASYLDMYDRKKYLNLLSVWFIIGILLGAIIAYQQIKIDPIPLNSLLTTQSNTITTITPQSYYEGTVQAIVMNAPGFLSYVQFTSGQKEYGNLSAINNLSIGADCRLLLNQSNQNGFIKGACK